MSFFVLSNAQPYGKQLKKSIAIAQVYYALLGEISQSQTRNKYTYARLRFYEFQSGIFAFISPRCRSPPLPFDFSKLPKSKGWYKP